MLIIIIIVHYYLLVCLYFQIIIRLFCQKGHTKWNFPSYNFPSYNFPGYNLIFNSFNNILYSIINR